MMKRTAILEAFEKERIRREPPDHAGNLRLFDSMYEFARKLGALPPGDLLDGLETDLRVASAINDRRVARRIRARSREAAPCRIRKSAAGHGQLTAPRP